MSRLIASIMLSIVMFPFAAVVYLLTFVGYMQANRGYYSGRREDTGFAIAGIVTWTFLALYWLALWRKSVVWTSQRRVLTGLSFIGAAAVAGVVGIGMSGIERTLGIFVATIIAPLVWLAATIFVWRENAGERASRLAQSGPGGIVCPTCGYNLTGLKGSRCPECGTEFTIDQLLACQPAKAAAELET